MSLESQKRNEKIAYGGDESQVGTAYIPFYPEGTRLDDSTSIEGAKVGLARNKSKELRTHAAWIPVNIQQIVDEEVARLKKEEAKKQEPVLSEEDKIEQILRWKAEEKEKDRALVSESIQAFNNICEIINIVLGSAARFIQDNPDIVIKIKDNAEKAKQTIKVTAQNTAKRVKTAIMNTGIGLKTIYNETKGLPTQAYTIEEQGEVIDRDNRVKRSKEEIQELFMAWIEAQTKKIHYEKQAQAVEENLLNSVVDENKDYALTDERKRAIESILRNNKRLLDPQFINGVLRTLNHYHEPEEMRRIEEAIPFDHSYLEQQTEY